METRYNDRLAIALRSGKACSIDASRRTAVFRREHRQDLKLYEEKGTVTLRGVPGLTGPVLVDTLSLDAESSPEQLAEEEHIRERLKELLQPRTRPHSHPLLG